MARVLVLMILLFLIQSVASSSAEPTLTDRYLMAYLHMNDAEHLEKEDHLRGAYTLYLESSKQLKRICLEDPGNAGDIDPSIRHIEKKLAELRTKIDAQLHQYPNPQPWRGRPGS